MSNFNVMIKGHTLEFRTSGSGSIDPWTRDYAREHNIALIGTADVKDFVKVDDTWIYKIIHGYTSGFYEKYSNDELKTWEEVQDWLKENCYIVKNVSEIENTGT